MCKYFGWEFGDMMYATLIMLGLKTLSKSLTITLKKTEGKLIGILFAELAM